MIVYRESSNLLTVSDILYMKTERSIKITKYKYVKTINKLSQDTIHRKSHDSSTRFKYH